MITSAVSTTSAGAGVGTGVAVSGALVAVLLFVALLVRECTISTDANPRARQSVNAVLLPLAATFALNVLLRAVAAAA